MTTRFSNLSLPVASGARRRTAGVFFVLALITWLASANPARAQLGSLQQVQVKDTSALHPPAGARVAIVEFDDLECPFCAQANPTLMQAAAHYKIPWVRHDFLIPGHIWSPRAAIYARWFDAKSKALGDDYRNQVFANQSSIETLGEMNQFTQKFAAPTVRLCRLLSIPKVNLPLKSRPTPIWHATWDWLKLPPSSS